MVHPNLSLVVFQHRIRFAFYWWLFDKLLDVFSTMKIKDTSIGLSLSEKKESFFLLLSLPLSIIIDNKRGDKKKKYDHLTSGEHSPEKRLFLFLRLPTHFVIKKKKKNSCPEVISLNQVRFQLSLPCLGNAFIFHIPQIWRSSASPMIPYWIVVHKFDIVVIVIVALDILQKEISSIFSGDFFFIFLDLPSTSSSMVFFRMKYPEVNACFTLTCAYGWNTKKRRKMFEKKKKTFLLWQQQHHHDRIDQNSSWLLVK